MLELLVPVCLAIAAVTSAWVCSALAMLGPRANGLRRDVTTRASVVYHLLVGRLHSVVECK